MNLNDFFILNPTSKVVMGYSRSIICDLERKTFYFIPNILADILLKHRTSRVCNVINSFASSDDELRKIISYFEFLVSKDLVFFSKSYACYSSINEEWEYSGAFSNAIIDFDGNSHFSIESCAKQMIENGCRTIQIRFFKAISLKEIASVAESVELSMLESLHIIMPYTSQELLFSLIDLVEDSVRLRSIILYNYPEDKVLFTDPNTFSSVVGTSESVMSSNCCGKISPDYFTVSTRSFAENKKYNSCLNKKISVDVNGNIKNCPSMVKSYGNILDVNIAEVANKEDFSKLQLIKKDDVEVCRYCEFRYICSDCRAYLLNPDDVYSKPLKCGYDPKSMTWEDSSNNFLKTKPN